MHSTQLSAPYLSLWNERRFLHHILWLLRQKMGLPISNMNDFSSHLKLNDDPWTMSDLLCSNPHVPLLQTNFWLPWSSHLPTELLLANAFRFLLKQNITLNWERLHASFLFLIDVRMFWKLASTGTWILVGWLSTMLWILSLLGISQLLYSSEPLDSCPSQFSHSICNNRSTNVSLHSFSPQVR